MATFEVTIETITVSPHPNADRLELAKVGLYNIVVAKGEWVTGDTVLYIPEYSVLPENLIAKLGLEGKLSGSNHDRVKPVKLRGELSQGLVAPLAFLPEGELEKIGRDGNFAESLGIVKWEPAVPVSLSGDTVGNIELVSWIEIENLKKFPDMFIDGENVIVEEKIHGTASLYTFTEPSDLDGEVLVSSKGLGAKKLVLKQDDKNLYWKTVTEYNLHGLARYVADMVKNEANESAVVEKVALFGETYGSVQDLHYGYRNGQNGFALFDIHVTVLLKNKNERKEYWLDPLVVRTVAETQQVPVTPLLFTGPFSMEKIAHLASGKEQVTGKEEHIREGVVVRPVHREDGRRIGKYVSTEYLTRKGVNGEEPTEYN